MKFTASISMQKKILIYSPLAGAKPHFETDLELVESCLQKGNDVLLLTCNGEVKSCDLNPYHHMGKCYRCKSRRDQGIKWIGENRIQHHPFYLITSGQEIEINKILDMPLDSIEVMRSLIVEDSDIGLAALSSVVSILREPYPDLERHRDLIKSQIETALIVHFSLKNHILSYEPHELILYNGRLSILRPALRLAQKMKIQAYVHEVSGSLDRYSYSSNHSTHDLVKMKSVISDFYQNHPLSEEEKKMLAREWFESRYQNRDVSGFNFTKTQKFGLLPANIETNKLKIAIFNSSEDEMVAIDGWENPYYASQNEALEKIFSDLSGQDIQFILRVHPNLKGINNSQTRSLHNLQKKFSDVIFISADSQASSYEIMSNSDLIVTFGSTIGIEACYQNQPVFLLGRAVYEDAQCIFKPKNHDDLIEKIIAISKDGQFPENQKNDQDWVRHGFFYQFHGESFKFVKHLDLYQVELLKDGSKDRIQASIPSRILARLPF